VLNAKIFKTLDENALQGLKYNRTQTTTITTKTPTDTICNSYSLHAHFRFTGTL